MEKDTPMDEMIDGLLGIMPVGARQCTYIPAEAMEKLGRDSDNGKKMVKDEDIYKLPGVQTFAHGPYLDDWSKVPDEIAAKYNTCPAAR